MRRDLSIDYIPLQEVRRWPRNPKQHDLGDLHQSFARFGFTNPLIVNENTGELLAGHGRLETLEQRHANGEPPPPGIQSQNGTWLVPVVRGVTLPTEEAAAYAVADNRLVEIGGWNDADLADILQGLNLDGVGFDDDDVDRLLQDLEPETQGEAPDAQVDKAEELRDKWSTALGQVWEIPSKTGKGVHRLMCGDSTKKTDMVVLMKGILGHMVFTDPPYGVDYDGGAKKRAKLPGDTIGTSIYADSLIHLADCVDDAAALYLWYADGHAAAAAVAAAAAGYVIVAQIIWAKNHAQFVTTAHYKGKHEPCYYGHRKGQTARWHGPNNEVTLWEYDRASSNEYHPTQKPIPIAVRAIQNSTRKGQIVLDMFVGAGTTTVAAEQLGRICYGMEIEPKYVAVTLQRLADMGLEPRLRWFRRGRGWLGCENPPGHP